MNVYIYIYIYLHIYTCGTLEAVDAPSSLICVLGVELRDPKLTKYMMCIHIYIYIYIYMRERERERGREGERERNMYICMYVSLYIYIYIEREREASKLNMYLPYLPYATLSANYVK